MVANVRDASVYTDLSGLNAISQLGRENSPEALREVAKQFESMFLNMMLKGMRAGEEALFADNYLRSNEMQHHRENFDNQISLHMSEAGGIGLADTLHRQLMQRYEPETSNRLGIDGTLADARRFTGHVMHAAPTAVNAAYEAPGRELPPVELAVRELKVREAPAPAQTGAPVFSSPEEFVEHLLPIAESIAPQLGVDPRVLLAQSALETGWGQKMITGANGQPSYNLFGIKAGDSWQGDRVSVSTLEFRDGAMQRERASFRAYDSFEESFRDYVDLLRGQPRYASALENAADADAYGYHLQKAGYATDPDYADKISRVLRSPALGLN